jgi:Zn-dependent membrane protease YugP
MIRRMQGYGVLSMLTCIFAMVCLFQEWEIVGAALFGLSLLFLVISLWISFLEIRISVRALDILLADIEKD